MAKMILVQVLISMTANQGGPLLQFDVKNAFLYGDLKEEVHGCTTWILNARNKGKSV